jgi:DNA-binding transcriptional regulator YiaG
MIMDSFPACIAWQEPERQWIAWAKDKGEPLTNGTSGGDGVPDLTPEARAKIVAAWTGRKHRPETLLKIGAASRKRRHTQEWRDHMRQKMKGRHITWGDKISAATRKLTDIQVSEIRAALQAGLTQASLARQYGVDSGTISNIKRGLFYRDVL